MLTVQAKSLPADHHPSYSVRKPAYFWLISVRCMAQSTVSKLFIFLETRFLRRLAICSFYVSFLLFIYDNIRHELQSATEVCSSLLC
jgi:hypothetical protein